MARENRTRTSRTRSSSRRAPRRSRSRTTRTNTTRARTPRRPVRGRPARGGTGSFRTPIALGGVLLVALVFASGAYKRLGGERDLAAGCTILDVSKSTTVARTKYLDSFRAFATEDGTHGSGDLCLILAAGDPIAEGRAVNAFVGPTEDHRDSPDFRDGEIEQAVNAQVSQLDQVLANPPIERRGGSSLVEAAVVAADHLEPGDHLQILSDGLQTSPATGRIQSEDLTLETIDSLLDRLESQGLMADLDGVTIEFPDILYHPGGLKMTAAQQVAIRGFWEQWAERSGGSIEFNQSSDWERS